MIAALLIAVVALYACGSVSDGDSTDGGVPIDASELSDQWDEAIWDESAWSD
jgi:hypothetical protein